MKKLLIFLMFLFLLTNFYGQKRGPEFVDSLKTRLAGFSQDTGRVRLLGKISFQYYQFDTDSGIYYAEKAISLAEKLKWGTGIAFSWNYLGTNYAVKGNYPKALECFHHSLANYTEIGDQQGIAFLSNNLGNFYRIQKQYDKAKAYIGKAIKINLALHNRSELTRDYNNLGFVYFASAEYLKADSCYREALNIAQEIGNKALVSQILINISESKTAIRDFCGALESGIKAVKISEELNNQYDQAVFNGMVGEIFLRLADESSLSNNQCPYYSRNSKLNLLNARRYIVKSIELIDKINDLSLLSDHSLLLSQVYEKLGDSGNALLYYKKYALNKDSVFSADSRIRLAEIERNREVTSRDRKIEMQKLEIAHQNLQINYQIALFLLILLVTLLLFYFYYKKRTASHLRVSEEKYRTIFENLQDIFYQIDLNGNIIEISPSVEQFSEYKRAEIIGLPVYNFYAEPKDREQFIDTITSSGNLTDYELRIKTKSGVKDCIINARLILDRDGKPDHINGVIRDISERKKGEAELKASREKYHKDLVLLKSIFESPVDIIIFALDRNYCYTAFTQFHKTIIRKIWGVDIQIGTNMIDLISNQEDKARAKHNFDRALSGEYFIETEEYGDNLLHRTFYEDYYSSIKNAQDEIVGVSVYVIDVTHRREAEKRLVLLNRAIEQSPVTVLITDKKGTIEYVNPNFAEVTGYTLGETKGQNPRILNSGENSMEFYSNLWTTILSGNNWSGEFRNRKKNGDLFDESAVISPIVNPDGEISHFVAVKVDITDKKQMVEDLIRAKERAEESDKLKTAFLNNISHEIRTPFNGILGFLSIIQSDEVAPEERNEYIGIINKSADRLMNTINQIVEISQIQAGQTKVNLSKIRIKDIESELMDNFRSLAESQGLGITLRNELPENLEHLTTDGLKLVSILSNLISNAIKFTKEGTVDLAICKRDDLIEFAVADTGIGLAEDKLSIIFERFMQADTSNTRQFEGSGLGLSISKAYAEMLGGKIRVKSEKGKGSLFCLTVPLQSIPGEMNTPRIGQSEKTEGSQPDSKASGLKILIVEDDEQSAILLAFAVKTFGTNLIKVKTGRDAVSVCRDNPDIDLILMDIKMPELDGYEATRQIRQFNREVTIIAQTAYALSGDREKALEAGCNDYISKPIKKEDLVELLLQYF
jgi:PAS domain S-box-containing protein